ncbi:hydrolase [Chondromyces apiculatus DSM 436]|uniref:Hydrolase n=1 Tax=Chondromyces apiculatus DSM 436 TaxID=1192034 RepID=A0A017T2I4_9BACT|nr:hydrolase [Chondromyces apiculatus DSM 436]
MQLALLPEASFTGYVSGRGNFDLRRFAEPLDGPTLAEVAALACRSGVAIAAPLIEVDGACFYNSLVLVDGEGRRVGHWRKRHPWLPERWASEGNLGTPVVEVVGLRVTAAICFDIHFVSEEAGASLDAADVLLFPSAWVDSPAHVDLRRKILPAVARRHRIGVVNANWGPPRQRTLHALAGQGTSRILDARGRLVASAAPGAQAAVVRATVSTGPGEGDGDEAQAREEKA